MHLRYLPVLLLSLGINGCNSAPTAQETEPGSADIQTPTNIKAKVTDAYELANEVQLPDVAPQEFPELHNVYHLSENIISGSEPHGEAAFAELQAKGVKTILSVDGKTPDAELAARHGMRYVHAPIRYNGIEADEAARIAKTFRELEGPFYVHCFHGKHRGPAAAAVGRVALDGVERERALAEMRQWCGTSASYKGLYSSIASMPLPTAQESKDYKWDFPAAHPMEGFRYAMTEIPRLHDNIEMVADNDWAVDPLHPDLDPLNEAVKLLDLFSRANELQEVKDKPADFRQWMDDSVRDNAELVNKLKSGDHAGAMKAFESLQASCKSCHRVYRNAR